MIRALEETTVRMERERAQERAQYWAERTSPKRVAELAAIDIAAAAQGDSLEYLDLTQLKIQSYYGSTHGTPGTTVLERGWRPADPAQAKELIEALKLASYRHASFPEGGSERGPSLSLAQYPTGSSDLWAATLSQGLAAQNQRLLGLFEGPNGKCFAFCSTDNGKGLTKAMTSGWDDPGP